MLSQFLLHHLFTLSFSLFLLLSAADSDLAALLHLRSAVGGRTRRWNTSHTTPCSWFGVTCDNTGRVTTLRLPGSTLSGEIPPNTIGNLTRLRYLSLRSNSLSGSLPSDLSSCTELEKLILQRNQFSGEIPTEFNRLTKLKTLYLENNNLDGSIPEINSLSKLQKFNASYNKLNGSIPSTLSKFSESSFLGNDLCGRPLSPCTDNNGNNLSTGEIAGIVIGSVVGLILILVVSIVIWRKYSAETTPRQVVMAPSSVPSPVKPAGSEFGSPRPMLVKEYSGLRNGYSGRAGGRDNELVFFGDGAVEFTLEALLTASAEVVGKGTFGSTYIAYLGPDVEAAVPVVVKRLKNVYPSRGEFEDEVEALGELAHENLLPLKAYYYGKQERLLLFDPMPMGSLDALLHGRDRAGAPSWEIRIRIALGAARGVEYLHSLGPNSSHGNIKSANILLADQYTARVSEYGINRLVSLNLALNLNGYCAPEVTDSRDVSPAADVYSFGVLLLELLTGKAPTDAIWNDDGFDLPAWVQSVIEERGFFEVFDEELLRFRSRNGVQMAELLHLGIRCSSRQPYNRPAMAEVARRIDEIYRFGIVE
ncbi:probable inactive receptor kinase RLK902 [Diospyros lotus]|uniref:probable inactive receptor kinase RLK902 n=1 Tax=Diospyros lotus TaxID=55363 RepID=UPI00225BF88B|nr:probable inactive receptor kinase RLK902 [Diospyros lotus]